MVTLKGGNKMTQINDQYTAANLLDGGWRPEDVEEMIEEYGLTRDEANDIALEMEMLMDAQDYRYKD